jgi:signal transduction histidine kinase/CBS domain-containing protein
MKSDPSIPYLSPLQQVIEYQFLTTPVQTGLADIFTMMTQAKNLSALLESNYPESQPKSYDWEGSCVLVMSRSSQAIQTQLPQQLGEALAEESLVGIFTIRDIIRLIATGKINTYNNIALQHITVGEVMTSPVITLTESEDQDLFTALSLFRQHNISHLPIIDQFGKVIGLITPQKIRMVLQPSNILKLRRVTEVMTAAVTAPITSSLLYVSQLMFEHQTDCVVITNVEKKQIHKPKDHLISSVVQYSRQKPVGLVTARDVVRALFANQDLGATSVEKVMRSLQPISSNDFLKPQDSLWIAHRQMLQQQMQLLVVVGEQGELQGVITQNSLLRVLDPTEMHRVVKKLQQSVYQLQTEKFELLRSRNEQLEQEVRERTARLQEQLERERLLSRITTRIHQSLDLQAIINAAVGEIQEFLQADRVIIARLVAKDNLVVVAESSADENHAWLGETLPVEFSPEYLPGNDYNYSLQAVVDTNQAKLTFHHRQWLIDRSVIAYLLVPILWEGNLWGVLSTNQSHFARQWQPSEIDLLQQIATQLAIAIQQAQLYETVQTLNTELEEQVKERTAQLEQKVQELQKLNILKDEFLSTVSHELRTPLANMKMAIKMLNLANTPEKQVRYLQILESECMRETDLITDLLDLQRLEVTTEDVYLETINLSIWLPTIIEPFYTRMQQRQQVLQVTMSADLPIVHSHVPSLGRILAELLNNACKYTASGCTIAFDCIALPDLSVVQLTITNPSEILPSEIPKIFDKFYRIPNADPWKQGGTGLGLALVKKLVDKLELKLNVNSSNGLTSFTLEIPYVDPL